MRRLVLWLLVFAVLVGAGVGLLAVRPDASQRCFASVRVGSSWHEASALLAAYGFERSSERSRVERDGVIYDQVQFDDRQGTLIDLTLDGDVVIGKSFYQYPRRSLLDRLKAWLTGLLR